MLVTKHENITTNRKHPRTAVLFTSLKSSFMSYCEYVWQHQWWYCFHQFYNIFCAFLVLNSRLRSPLLSLSLSIALWNYSKQKLHDTVKSESKIKCQKYTKDVVFFCGWLHFVNTVWRFVLLLLISVWKAVGFLVFFQAKHPKPELIFMHLFCISG